MLRVVVAADISKLVGWIHSGMRTWVTRKYAFVSEVLQPTDFLTRLQQDTLCPVNYLIVDQDWKFGKISKLTPFLSKKNRRPVSISAIPFQSFRKPWFLLLLRMALPQSYISNLGGGFKYFHFHPYLGRWPNSTTVIFFTWLTLVISQVILFPFPILPWVSSHPFVQLLRFWRPCTEDFPRASTLSRLLPQSFHQICSFHLTVVLKGEKSTKPWLVESSIFTFTPTWGNDAIWQIFSNGLKPRTRNVVRGVIICVFSNFHLNMFKSFVCWGFRCNFFLKQQNLGRNRSWLVPPRAT